MNGLGILITGAICVLLVLAVVLVVIPLIDAPEGRHTGYTSDDWDTGWGARPPEIASEPPPEFLPQFYPAPAAAQAVTPTAAGAQPPALAPPVLHHDEYAPAQYWHPELPQPANEGYERAVAVGAAIAATHARIAAIGRQRAAALEAEARATRPWADDTGAFTAICAEVA